MTLVSTRRLLGLSVARASGAYLPLLADPETITYNGDGTVATVTVQGVTTTYTYNADGTIATEVRAGVTRTYTYTGGNLTSVS